MFPTARTKVTVNGSYYINDRQYYEHRDVNGISYDFNLDGLSRVKSEAYLVGLKANYNKSANTVFSVSGSRFRTWLKQAPEKLFDSYWRQWPGYSEDSTGQYDGWIDDSNYQASPDYEYIGFTSGNDYDPYYLEKSAVYTGGRLAFLSQVDRHNQVKMGAELRRFELNWDNRQFYNAKPYGETYQAHPWYGAAYTQDKIELNDMVVNLGLRFDYMYSDVSYWHDPFVKDYKKTSKPKVQWSPRLGISHPVSENSVLHFNYGYLFQPPEARLMYTNLQGDLETGYPLIGNPDLDAEKTIYYELGWTRLINNSLRVSATTYYRDIKNMIGAREVVDDDGNPYTVFTNSDYGSCKGVDLSLESIGRRLLSWSAGYSYMIARGNASDPREWYYDYFTVQGDQRPVLPTREYPLSYDQRHSLTAVADFRVPRGEHPRLMGLALPDAWGLNVLAHYGSGLAYTRTDKNGNRVGQLNGERMPYTLRFDARFNRDFYLASTSGAMLSFFVEVENLFDRRNVVNVYTSTGSPDDDGLMALNVNSPTYEQEKLWQTLMARDPLNYENPRTVRAGLEFKF
jgi:outer membrane receptor protein involved in Fe transport